MDLFKLFKPSPAPEPMTPEELQRAMAMGSVAWSDDPVFLSDRKYNPDQLIGRKGFSVYQKMMHDEQVKAAVEFKIASIIGRDWYFELNHEEYGLSQEEAERRIDICNTMLKAYNGSFMDGLKCIMKAVWQGFSMTEKMFKLFDYEGSQYWGLYDLRSKPFSSFQAEINDKGDVLRWIQLGPQGQEQEIDINKFVYYRYHPEMDEHYGWSALRPAYRAYLAKDIAFDYFNFYLERLAGGFVVMKPKDGVSLIRGSKLWNDLISILKNITGKTSVLIPAGFDLEIVSSSGGSQVGSFEKALEIHDLAIAKALLVPNLLGLSHTGQTGAFSQSETQFEVYSIIVDAEADRLEEAMNEQAFGPLAAANFADGIAPKFRFKELSNRKKLAMLKAWGELVSSKAVQATDTDEAHIRDIMEFPEKGEPIQEPIPPALAGPGNAPDKADPEGKKTPIGQGDDDKINETVLGQEHLHITNARARESLAVAFSVAESRVSFAVIDRKSEDAVTEFTSKLEEGIRSALSEAISRIESEGLGMNKDSADEIGKFDLNQFKIRPIKVEAERMLKSAFALGEDHAKREIDLAKGEQFSKRFNFDRLGELAADFFNQKSFTISGDIRSGIVKTIKAALLNGLKYSWSERDIKKDIYRRLLNDGILSGAGVAQDLGFDSLTAMAEELAVKGGLEPYRLNTIIRTNMFEAINEARLNAFTDPSLNGFVRAMEYSAILDSRTTAICSALNGKVYSADDQIWNKYRPPNHFNCRSILIPITIVDDEVQLSDDRPNVTPQEGFG